MELCHPINLLNHILIASFLSKLVKVQYFGIFIATSIRLARIAFDFFDLMHYGNLVFTYDHFSFIAKFSS